MNALGSLIANPVNWIKSVTAIAMCAWNFSINPKTIENQSVTIEKLLVGSEETFTVQPVITINVSGEITIQY